MNSKTKTLLLPRQYLSWSQMSLYEWNPEQYRKIYILGEERTTTPEMEYGKRLATILEKGDDGKDILISGLYHLLPKYKIAEKELTAEMSGIKLLGLLDSYDPKTHNFYEYKTGKEWTQRKVDNHGQLTFYAMLIYLNYKILPKMKLIWVETEWKNGEIIATGRIKGFSTERTLVDILRFIARVKKTAMDISEMYRKELDKTLKKVKKERK